MIFGLVLTQLYNTSLIERTEKTMQDSNEILADRIQRVLIDAENCSNYLAININRIIEDASHNEQVLNDWVITHLINRELYSAQLIFEVVDAIAYIDTEEELYVSDVMLLENNTKIRDSHYIKELQDTAGKSIWFGVEDRDYLVTQKNEKVWTLGKKIWDINTGETLGYLFINIDLEELVKYLEDQMADYYLVDREDRIIASNREAGVSLRSNQDEDYVVVRQPIEPYGISLIGVTHIASFNVQETEQFSFLVILFITITVLAMIMSYSLTNMITTPIIRLKEGVDQISRNQLHSTLAFKSEDEIGQLANSFNAMTERIKELLHKVEIQEKKKREYELALLHEQVKPHFLYNTLDIIIKLSEMGKVKDANRVTKKLADYYRRSLSNSQEIVSIKEEIQMVEDYLELQMIRYYDLFEYEIVIDRRIEYALIPKLTLQPIVENAIYHGLKYREGTGRIVIKGTIENDKIVLSVRDNGMGIKEEQLGVLAQLKEKSHGHFGLYSVNHRLALFFGETYGAEINSVYGEGTVVSIYLPKEEMQ